MKIKSKTMKNGLKIIYAADPSYPLISAHLFVRVGSAYEDREEAGFSHFTEHLLFKSTRKFPYDSLMENVSFLGGQINAFTEYESTCFYLTLPSKFREKGLEILAELAFNSNYDENDFQYEKRVVIEELKQYRNNPEEHFLENIAAEYFIKNSFKNPIIGNPDNLQKATRQKLQDFYRKYYIPNNCFLVITGDFGEKEIFNEIEQYFGAWQPVSLPKTEFGRDDIPSQPQIRSFHKNIAIDMLAFVLPDRAESHPDADHLYLAQNVLAMGKNSRLFKRLFDREKLIDSIKVHSFSGINDGALVILILPKKQASLAKIVEIVLDELRRFIHIGLNEIEMQDTKKELINYYRYSFESVENLASSLGSEEIQTAYENYLNYDKKIAALKLPQMNEVIGKYFKPESLYIYHLGAKDFPSEKIIPHLQQYSKTKRDIPENVFETRLPNNSKLLLKKVKGKETVGIAASFRVSQLNEREERGINLLTSGMLLYGNEKQDYTGFLKFCTSNGIQVGIIPEMETTTVKIKCFKENLTTALQVLSDMISTPVFPKEHLDNLKNTYISNIDRIKDYPNYFARYEWLKLIFGKNSNLLNREGVKTHLRRIGRNKIRKWYETCYNPGNMALAIVGDIDFNETVDCLEDLFQEKSSALSGNPQQALLGSTGIKKKKIITGSDQAIINLGGFACSSLQKEKNTAFHVLAQIIGGDGDSLLFNELRSRKGLAYSVYFSFRSIAELGFFLSSTIVDKNNEKLTIKMLRNILLDLKNNNITENNLIKIKNHIRGQRLFDEESVSAQAYMLSVLDALDLGWQHYQKRDERLNKVNIDLLHHLAAEYFTPENFFIHTLA